MTAFRESGRIVVVVPASMSAASEAEHVPRMVAKLLARERREQSPRSDADLTARARALWDAHLRPAVGEPPEFGVRWVSNQHSRWGSNTVQTGEIRLSSRLQDLPAWVIDAVIVHELVHFVEKNHTTRFWDLMRRYPRAEQARGFLEAVEFFDARSESPDAGRER